jgi:hypothetical protein
MRRALFVALMVAAAGAAQPAVAQVDDIKMIHFIPVANAAPVAVDGLVLNGPEGRAPTDVCVAFHDTDPRPVKSVRFAFIYYDDVGNRGGDETFTRNGKFGTGIRDKVDIPPGRYVRLPECLTMRPPRRGISGIAYYVDHVDFADGTTWNSPAVTAPDHPAGTFSVAPAAS